MEYSIRVLIVIVVLLIMAVVLSLLIFQWGGQLNQSFGLLTDFFNRLTGAPKP